MAKFEKGHKKLGGRKPGIPNKARLDLWEKLNSEDWDITSDLKDRLKLCSDEMACKILLELHKFIYPTAKPPEEEDPSDLSNEELITAMKDQIKLLESREEG